MNDHPDLVDRLEALGRTRPAEPGADRLRAIEDRVLASSGPSDVRRRSVPVLLVAAAVIAVVVLGVLALGPNGGGLVVDAAEGVTLEFADGRTAPAAPGDALPDGTVVVVDPGGRLVVDDDVIGPGRYLVVDGGFRPSLLADTTSSTSTVPVTMEPSPGGRTSDDGTLEDGSTSPPVRVTVAPTTEPSDAPADRPTSTLARDRTPPDTAPPADTTVPTTSRTTTTVRPTDRTTTTVADRPPATTRPADPTTTTTTTTTTVPRTTVPDRDRGDRAGIGR